MRLLLDTHALLWWLADDADVRALTDTRQRVAPGLRTTLVTASMTIKYAAPLLGAAARGRSW